MHLCEGSAELGLLMVYEVLTKRFNVPPHKPTKQTQKPEARTHSPQRTPTSPAHDS